MLVDVINRVPPRVAAHFRSGSVAARLLAPALELVLPNRKIQVVVRSGPAAGIRLLIDPRREKFYWTGAYELEVQRTIERLLQSGACFWDVGAHIGFFTALAARCVGSTGRVHSFEPLPANCSRLLDTVELNTFVGVEVHPTAVAGRAGKRQLYGHASTSMWSLVERTTAPRLDVQCDTLDGLLTRHSFGIPALVKVDVEGLEMEVLRGGIRLLREHGPAVIVEFSSSGHLDEACKLLPFYAFRRLDETNWLLEAHR